MAQNQQSNDHVTRFAQLLYGVLFFNIFTQDELCDIVREERLIKWKKFEKGSLIFQEGTYDQHFYVVIQGTILIMKADGGENVHVGALHSGEILGEMVVCDPEKPRRASAYVSHESDAVMCEIDGTLIDTVAPQLQVKFLKKFLDLVLGRFERDDGKEAYYDDIVNYARENKIEVENDFVSYAMETSVNSRTRLTQLIKYTDYLVSSKIDPESGCMLLRRLLMPATEELDKNLRSI